MKMFTNLKKKKDVVNKVLQFDWIFVLHTQKKKKTNKINKKW